MILPALCSILRHALLDPTALHRLKVGTYLGTGRGLAFLEVITGRGLWAERTDVQLRLCMVVRGEAEEVLQGGMMDCA